MLPPMLDLSACWLPDPLILPTLPCLPACMGALQVVIQVLTDTSGAKKAMPKQQFLDRLSECLTAAEQVSERMPERSPA